MARGRFFRRRMIDVVDAEHVRGQRKQRKEKLTIENGRSGPHGP